MKNSIELFDAAGMSRAEARDLVRSVMGSTVPLGPRMYSNDTLGAN